MSRSRSDIQHVLFNYVAAEFFSGEIDRMPAPDQNLVGPFVDSIGLHSVIAFIESEFSVKVEDSELTLDNFSTLDGMTAFVETKLAASGRYGN